MKMVIPYQIPFLAKEVGPELTEGVYASTDFWWTLEDRFPLAKMFVAEFEKKYGYKPEWGANNGYMQFAVTVALLLLYIVLYRTRVGMIVRAGIEVVGDPRRGF